MVKVLLYSSSAVEDTPALVEEGGAVIIRGDLRMYRPCDTSAPTSPPCDISSGSMFYLQVVLRSHHRVHVQLQLPQLNSMSLYDDVIDQRQLLETLRSGQLDTRQ